MTTATASETGAKGAGRAGGRPLSIVLLLAVMAPSAQALDFRLRWRPVPGAGITGYKLHVRPQGADYGPAVAVGLPAPASDGTVSATLTGLQVGPRYFFAVSAVAGTQESGFSNEISTCTTASQCDDNNPCTTDACTAGACKSTAATDGTTCADGNLCNGDETCQHGICTHGDRRTCTDGNACTRDSCNPSTGCVFTPTSDCRSCLTASQCDDGNPCTSDTCTARGMCTSFLVSGCSRCTADAQCDDHNPCTSDRCTAGRCQSTQRPPGASCSDGDPCNGEETCQAGRCTATDFPCDDGDACTADLCSPTEGCTHVTSPSCESCASMERGTFEANWIAFIPAPGGQRLTAMGVLEPAAPIDPPSTGVLLEIGNSTGGINYRVSIPPGGFKVSPSGRFFRLNKHLRQLRLDGLKRLDMLVTPSGPVRVFFRAKQKDFGADFPKGYTWTMLFGDQCGVGDCFLHPRHPQCR